jgi:hypothetical protein
MLRPQQLPELQVQRELQEQPEQQRVLPERQVQRELREQPVQQQRKRRR